MLFNEYELWPQNELNIFGVDEISEVLYSETVAEGRKYLDNDWKVLKASMYTDSRHDEFIEIYKSRRIALSSLASAEFVEKKGRFIKDIIDGIWCICEESTWEKPDSSGMLRDIEKPRFDINASKTAALLALCCHLFGNDIPENVKKRVLFEVRRRVLSLFSENRQVSPEMLSYTFTACMFLEPDEEERHRFVDKTLEILDVFLSGYSENNIKARSELSLYRWSSYIFDILEILYNVTDKKLEVYSDEKIKLVTESIYKSYLGSDGFMERAAEADGARIYMFGKRMDYKQLIDFGASEYIKLKEKCLPDSYNLFHKLYSIQFASEIDNYGDNFDGQESGYIESMDLYVKKTKGFSVAVKGGAYNAGNFMAYLENEPYVVDLEKSHNLPIVNGFSQFANTKNIQVVQLENGITIDMSKTYPKEAGVESWIRTVIAEESYIVISDEYELSKNDDIRIIMLMRNKPILSGDRILLGSGSIIWEGNLALRVELVRSKNYGFVYRLVFHAKDDESVGRIRIALKK